MVDDEVDGEVEDEVDDEVEDKVDDDVEDEVGDEDRMRWKHSLFTDGRTSVKDTSGRNARPTSGNEARG